MMRSARRACLSVLQRSGGLSVVGASAWRRARLLILCYHGISLEDEHQWNGALYISQERFSARLRQLKSSRACVLPLGEALDRLAIGDLPPLSVVLTFDDGYHDFVAQAWPLLGDYGYAATVYLPTANCGRNAPVFGPACSYVLWKGRGKVVHVPEVSSEALDLRSEASIETAAQRLKDVAIRDGLSLADKNALLRRLAAAIGVDYEHIAARRLLQIMSPSDVRRLSDSGIDFELHTHRHRTLTDRDQFKEEIETNRARLTDMSGRPARHFCYPDGRHRPEFVPWLRELGIVSATTCDPGLVAAGTPLLLLPRFVDTTTVSAAEFVGWLSGAGPFFTRRRGHASAAVL
jgi:peptidoglycan/xylan/chitin deacetylase (PgdA/CDA1 family)